VANGEPATGCSEPSAATSAAATVLEPEPAT